MISPFHDSSEDSSNSEKSDSEIEEVSKSKNSKDEVFNNSNYHSPNKKVRQNDRILQSFWLLIWVIWFSNARSFCMILRKGQKVEEKRQNAGRHAPV